MISKFRLKNGTMAGIKEGACFNCLVNKACLVISHTEPLICFQCIAAFFSNAIPVPTNDKEYVVGFETEATTMIAMLHDLTLHAGQRAWNKLEDSERLEKLKMADRLLPMLRNYFK